jgi:hypothetical protein
MQIPDRYHSRVRFGSCLAISLRAKKSTIRAITDKKPRIAVIVAENFNSFIKVYIWLIMFILFSILSVYPDHLSGSFFLSNFN